MSKKRYADSVLGKPIPSAKVPWFVILCLLAALVLVYMGFLRTPSKLLGPPIPRNEYLRLQQTAPSSAVQPPVTIPQPPGPAHLPPTPSTTSADAEDQHD